MGSGAATTTTRRSSRRRLDGGRRGRRPAAALLLAFSSLSCGYSFSGSALPSHVKTVAVPVFENATLEYDIERELTEQVIDAFVRDNHLRVVGQKQADAVLLGRITGYENKVFSFSSGETAQEYIVKIRVSASLKDQVDNKEIWKDDRLEGTATYAVAEQPGKPAATEQEGRRPAFDELARKILARTMEEW